MVEDLLELEESALEVVRLSIGLEFLELEERLDMTCWELMAPSRSGKQKFFKTKEIESNSINDGPFVNQ
jgi:hypothetical protein